MLVFGKCRTPTGEVCSLGYNRTTEHASCRAGLWLIHSISHCNTLCLSSMNYVLDLGKSSAARVAERYRADHGWFLAPIPHCSVKLHVGGPADTKSAVWCSTCAHKTCRANHDLCTLRVCCATVCGWLAVSLAWQWFDSQGPPGWRG